MGAGHARVVNHDTDAPDADSGSRKCRTQKRGQFDLTPAQVGAHVFAYKDPYARLELEYVELRSDGTVYATDGAFLVRVTRERTYRKPRWQRIFAKANDLARMARHLGHNPGDRATLKRKGTQEVDFSHPRLFAKQTVQTRRPARKDDKWKHMARIMRLNTKAKAQACAGVDPARLQRVGKYFADHGCAAVRIEIVPDLDDKGSLKALRFTGTLREGEDVLVLLMPMAGLRD